MSETWENKEEPVVPVPLASQLHDRWEGEDEDDDVKDNWDDEDEEPKSESVTDEVPKPKPAKKNKLKDKIAEKEAKAAAAKLNRPMTQEELLADKLERQRLQEEADLNLGKEAFGIIEGGSGLEGALSSKEDFDTFKKSLVTRLQSVEKSPHYISFLEAAFREICASLDPDDIKRLSSNLNSLFNEKVKSLKGPAKKKTKPKGAGIKVERSAMEVGDDGYDEFEDFM